MTFNASDRKQVRQKEKESSLADRNRIAFVRRVMSELEGRAYFHAFLEGCTIFGEPFVRGSADATAFNLGRQSVGKQVFADIIVHCPTEYIMMMQEANVKEILNERRNSDDRVPGTGEHDGSPPTGRDVEGSVDYDPYARAED